MNEIRPRAVSTGFLLDIFGTWCTTLAIVALTPGLAALHDDQQAVFLASDTRAQVAGALWTVVAGFYAAFRSPDHELANAFALGILSTLFGFLAAFSGPTGVPFEYEALGIAITIPLAVAGGWLRAVTRPRTVAP